MPMDTILMERGCFVGLATAAIEAYNRETDGFLVGDRALRVVRDRRRPVTVLRAAYPLQTAERKPNWVAHGNARAFQRAKRAMENQDLGYEVLGGFHSHTGDDGAASLSSTDLDYVAGEIGRRIRSEGVDRWLEVVVALRRRSWSKPHRIGWTTRPYRRKLGCTVALDSAHGYELTLGGFWVRPAENGARKDGAVQSSEARLYAPWSE